jgi:mono/diheme cytochrome c family protein
VGNSVSGEAEMRWVKQGDWGLVGCGHRGFLRAALAALIPLVVVAFLLDCDVERRQSDAELGLNPQQAAGRRIYDDNCDRCHEPYSTKGKKGPGLKGIFKEKYLPISGLPANDERVSDIIRLGRKEMPGYSQKLSQQELDELLAYMHTL